MIKKNNKYYRVPDEFWFRIHFVRPRFKSNIENVLLYMASECCKIPASSCDDYNKKYLAAIRAFPGNADMTKKTLQNWRTEIPALFGFYVEDKNLDITKTSRMAWFLYENQDLTQFLRLFLLSFQFPGGHLKPQDLEDIIYNGIKFKPAKMLIMVLMAGNEIYTNENSAKDMSISAEEATYCIFNDLRVTGGTKNPHEIAKTILNNRKNKLKYYNPRDIQSLSLTGKPRTKGDMTRYAKDILDYMELANLVECHNGYYYLKGNELATLKVFVNDLTWFKGYDEFYGRKYLTVAEISKVEPAWYDYVNKSMRPDLFKTDIHSLFKSDDEVEVVFDDRIKNVISSEDTTTKDIGNLGEAIICSHEKMRLKIGGYDDFVRLVQVVDEPSYHPGFDIDSFEGDGTNLHRYIEVKTTISKRQIQMYGFHMSPNEWSVAETTSEHYCVYRLMLSDESKVLYILRNPVSLYKKDKIKAEPRDGMEITFDNNAFETTELLTWKR